MLIKSDLGRFPCLSTTLTNLKGEKWKEIPGFDGLYELSNYGRVKSLGRWIDYGKFDAFCPERIIKLRLTPTQGKTKRVDLQMKLHKNKKRYQFSVARYVYYLFVAPFDLEDHTVIVTRKNGDTLNCYYKDLLLRSISDVAKEGFATNKRKSRFQLQVKPVTQYDPDGKKIRTYKTQKKAGEATGISSDYISGAARTKDRMAGGYYWRYGEPKLQINVTRLKKLPDDANKIVNGKSRHYYLNRNNKTIPGEKWKAVKGFEGFYEVSSYGRVKSLRRLKDVVTGKGNTSRYWTKEFMMKQSVLKSYCKYPIFQTVTFRGFSLLNTCILTSFGVRLFNPSWGLR
ncbi:MAG TPA: NUMOD4 domain-containing protein [Chitinophagaceae bacterium]